MLFPLFKKRQNKREYAALLRNVVNYIESPITILPKGQLEDHDWVWHAKLAAEENSWDEQKKWKHKPFKKGVKCPSFFCKHHWPRTYQIKLSGKVHSRFPEIMRS